MTFQEVHCQEFHLTCDLSYPVSQIDAEHYGSQAVNEQTLTQYTMPYTDIDDEKMSIFSIMILWWKNCGFFSTIDTKESQWKLMCQGSVSLMARELNQNRFHNS